MGQKTLLSQVEEDRIREIVQEFGEILDEVQRELQVSGGRTTNASMERRAMGSPKVRDRGTAEAVVWAARKRVSVGIMVTERPRSTNRMYR